MLISEAWLWWYESDETSKDKANIKVMHNLQHDEGGNYMAETESALFVYVEVMSCKYLWPGIFKPDTPDIGIWYCHYKCICF